jgi:hypothetical protein
VEALFESVTGARHLLFSKWCVSCELKVTNGSDSSLQNRLSHLILGGDALRTSATCGGDTVGLYCIYLGTDEVQFRRPYHQIVGFVGRVMLGIPEKCTYHLCEVLIIWGYF